MHVDILPGFMKNTAVTFHIDMADRNCILARQYNVH